MSKKIKIIEVIELENDLVCVIGKKLEEEKRCKGCEHFKYFGDLSIHYCAKHKGVVEENDICIEVGM